MVYLLHARTACLFPMWPKDCAPVRAQFFTVDPAELSPKRRAAPGRPEPCSSQPLPSERWPGTGPMENPWDAGPSGAPSWQARHVHHGCYTLATATGPQGAEGWPRCTWRWHHRCQIGSPAALGGTTTQQKQNICLIADDKLVNGLVNDDRRHAYKY